MELYHLHLLGNHDRLYKENSEFIVDKNKFNNRIYNRIYEANSTVDVNKYKRIVDIINYYCIKSGYTNIFEHRINLGEIIGFILAQDHTKEELTQSLLDAKEMILTDGINLREMALEEYRKENCINLPSRMHSLFACSEEGIGFWADAILDGDIDIYRIDVIDEPFVSNEYLLPDENLNYGDKILASYKYFHPNKKDLNPMTNEYLVQGKVKILKKICEVRN